VKVKRAEPMMLADSVVKIFTVGRRASYTRPWDHEYQLEFGGSGCILDGERILTNAHVVSDQVYVRVRRASGTQKFDARVEFVDHGSETALLSVKDRSFFQGSQPVVLGKLPKRKDRVAVYGFPVGGDDLSITSGIVSRIEVKEFTHSRRQLLAVQIDAPINPGNSGGPVFKRDELVGIAFESYSGSSIEKTGYLVPVPVIQHFLDDVKNGVCEGVPGLGAGLVKLESKELRALLGMTAEQTGLLVHRINYGSSAWGLLREQDVVMRVDGTPVLNDGSVRLGRGERLRVDYLFTSKQVGETLELGILRGGQPLTVRLSLMPPAELVPRPQYDVRPTYIIFAGLVLVPLTYDYMWKDDPPDPRFAVHYLGWRTEARKQVVVLSEVLPHRINLGVHDLSDAIVERVNGVPITELNDLVEALSRPQGAYHLFETDLRAFAVRAEDAGPANREILARFGIARDRSADLADGGPNPSKFCY
jgi:S1-C subfamily serine protease